MWVIQGDWILKVSKATSIMLSEAEINVYWDANADPDVLSFDDEDSARVEFDKIVKGIVDGEKIVKVNG